MRGRDRRVREVFVLGILAYKVSTALLGPKIPFRYSRNTGLLELSGKSGDMEKVNSFKQIYKFIVCML